MTRAPQAALTTPPHPARGNGKWFPTTRAEGRELDLADDSLVLSIQGGHTEVKTRKLRAPRCEDQRGPQLTTRLVEGFRMFLT